MTLLTVELTWDFTDALQSGESAFLQAVPTNPPWTNAAGMTMVDGEPLTQDFTGGAGSLAGIVANDNPLSPPSQGYEVSVRKADGTVLYDETIILNHAAGATQDLSSLTPAGQVGVVSPYLLAASNLSDVASPSTSLANLGGASSAALSAETTRAETAEGVLAGGVAANTATGAANAAAITAETTRAEGAETTLAGGIAANATAISAETTRATAAEGALTAGVAARLPLAGGTVTGQFTLTARNTWDLDGFTGTDDQKMTAFLAAWLTAKGGTLQVPARTVSLAAQVATPLTAGTAMPLRILGQGAVSADAPGLFAGATAISLAYAGAGAARLDFQHAGSIEIAGILFQDSGGSPLPFFQSTNPVPNIHDNAFAGSATGTACFQDAIVLGGFPGNGSGDAAQYGGYAGEVCRNGFTGIRRAVLLNPAANNVNIYGNTVAGTCGSNLYLGACIELNGTTPLPCLANNIYSNCIELSNYAFGIKGTTAQQNTLGPNGMFDPGAGTYGAIVLDANSVENTVLDFFSPASMPLMLDPTIQRNSVQSAARPSVLDGRSVLRAGAVTVSAALGTGPFGEDQNGYLGGWQTALYQGGFPSLTSYVIPSAEVTDGSLISGSNVITSLTANWTNADIGERISSAGHLPVTALITWAWTPATAFPWQPSFAYAAGQVTRPATANGHLYQCTTAGTTAASQPSFPTGGGTVTDGTAVWTDIGASSAVQASGNATATLTAQNVFFGRQGTPQPGTVFVRGHILGSGAAPAAAVQAAAGSGATATMTGHDLAMSLTLTTGTGPAAGELAVITFAQPYAVTPQVSLTPTNAAAAALLAGGMYVVKATGTLQVWCLGTPPASTACTFDIHTLGS